MAKFSSDHGNKNKQHLLKIRFLITKRMNAQHLSFFLLAYPRSNLPKYDMLWQVLYNRKRGRSKHAE
ncbi:hypothetical protein I872_01230 [Streptococcus cristatus AS 1.3089]|uniref:Uncharacterized protein n=1 Tax=Streptococcus cristatus AS 1.3089 TaxID=1302863 RepID=A0ABM5NHW5_STRCR|nr:hypothetical protein I872_01230 [Streptococcus cristatus AS 1.3089]